MPPAPSPPQPKHVCNRAQPCSISLFTVGTSYHSFPTGVFKARYIPPNIPRQHIDQFIKSPPHWDWTIRSGPNTGHSIHIPTIPTLAPKGAPPFDRFCADIFFAFKAHLSPSALVGCKVPRSLLHIYVNNMVTHFKHCASSFISAAHAKHIISPPSVDRPQSFAARLAAHPSLPPNTHQAQTIADLQTQVAQLSSQLAALPTS